MSTDKFILKGFATALVTPFKDGEVDMEAFAGLVERQVKAEADFIVPLGSTGETPCLEDGEKIAIAECTASLAGGKPVMVGVGTNSFRQTVRNIRLLEDHGADLFLVVVPYYNKPTQRGLYEYFKAVASETDKPVVLYNVPSRTGTNMETDTVLRLAGIDNIVAIKEASGNLQQIRRIIEGAPEGFTVLSGNDDQTLDIMKMGGAGVISVAGNIAPNLMVDFVEAVSEGDAGKAEKMNGDLMPLFKACFIESNPIPVKAGLASLGLIQNELRLPLVPCEASTYEKLSAVISSLGDKL